MCFAYVWRKVLSLSVYCTDTSWRWWFRSPAWSLGMDREFDCRWNRVPVWRPVSTLSSFWVEDLFCDDRCNSRPAHKFHVALWTKDIVSLCSIHFSFWEPARTTEFYRHCMRHHNSSDTIFRVDQAIDASHTSKQSLSNLYCEPLPPTATVTYLQNLCAY